MTVGELIEYCRNHGIALIPQPNGRLKYKGPAQVITDDILNELRAHKLDLLNVLTVMDVFEGYVTTEDDLGDRNYEKAPCTYKIKPGIATLKYAHPAVCERQRTKGDPQCLNCKFWEKRVVH